MLKYLRFLNTIYPLLTPSLTQSLDTLNLNYNSLGDVVFAGDFSSLLINSNGTQEQQQQQQQLLDPPTTNDGVVSYNKSSNSWTSQSFVDGHVNAACSLPNEKTYFIAGNFSKVFDADIDGGLAIVNLTSKSATSISSGNITGSNINVVWCNSTNVYVGGNFSLQGGYGVAVWGSSNNWELPKFGGFDENSTVYQIAEYGDNMIFSGDFTWSSKSLNLSGSTTDDDDNSDNSDDLEPGTQLISLNSARATGYAYAGAEGSDASAVLCPKSGSNGWQSGMNSLSGYIEVELAYTSYLSKIRVYNNNGGSATKTFTLYSFPAGGILNLTYTDDDGSIKSCTAACPLPQDQGDKGYTEFSFVNSIPSETLRLVLLDYYTERAGINGISLFQSGQVVFANNDYNVARQCSSSDTMLNSQSASASTEGRGWDVESDFLSTVITDKTELDQTTATFTPWFTQYTKGAGEYLVNLHTPGCSKYDTCQQRGIVNVTIYPGYGSPQNTLVYQTNLEDKYDLIYDGKLTSGAYVKLTPTTNNVLPLELVAYKIELFYKKQMDDDLELYNLFEYDAANFTTNGDSDSIGSYTDVVGLTYVNSLAANITNSSFVSSTLLTNNKLYISGHDFPSEISNENSFVLSLDTGDIQSLENGGEDMELQRVSNKVFGVSDSETFVLDSDSDSFESLDVGFSTSIQRVNYNDTNSVAFFNSSNGVHLLDPDTTDTTVSDATLLKGHLDFGVEYSNETVYFGSIQLVNAYTQSNAVVNSQNGFSSPLNSDFTTGAIYDGIYTDENSGLVVGGFGASKFTNDDIQLLDIPSNFNSSLYTVDAVNNTAAFGGSNGVLLYDLSDSTALKKQPQFSSGNVNISSLSFRPNSSLLAIGGDFQTSDKQVALGVYDLERQKWVQPAIYLESGSVINDLVFVNANQLAIAGKLNSSEVGVYNFLNHSITLLPSLPGDATNLAVMNNTGDGTSNGTATIVACGYTNSDSKEPFISVYDSENQEWTEISTDLTAESRISKLAVTPLQNNGSQQALTIAGDLRTPNGNSSLMILNDSQLTSLISTRTTGNENGMILTLFSKLAGKLKGSAWYTTTLTPDAPTPTSTPKPSSSTTDTDHDKDRKYRPVGHVVGISCGIGLGCTLLISLIYLAVEFAINYNKTNIPYQNLNEKSNDDGMLGTRIVK